VEAVREYTGRVDSKKRIVLRNPGYAYFYIKEFENGCILLEPRELSVPDSISAKTLKDMDKAVANFKAGNVSEPIDLSDIDK